MQSLMLFTTYFNQKENTSIEPKAGSTTPLTKKHKVAKTNAEERKIICYKI